MLQLGPRSRAAAALVMALVCIAGTASADVDRCEQSCGKPTQLSFCSIGYSVCKTHATWKAQDAAANASYVAILAASGVAETAITADCRQALTSLECDITFPACEISDEVKRVCKSQCGVVAAKCKNLKRSAICAGEMSTEGNCYTLEYQGPEMGMWLAGFLISVVFSFLAALGINLQKHSMRMDEQQGMNRPAVRQPMWVTGFLLIFLGSILDFVAFGLAPQTFLAPLGALSLVWNIILAPKFHGERVTRRNLWATVIIFVGVTSTVIFSTHVTPKYRLDDILYLFTQAVFIVYAVSIGLALTGLYMLAKYIEKHNVPWSLTHCVCYGGLAGIFGGQSVMLAKSVVELVKSALFEGGDAFSHFPTYLLVAGMAFTLLSQITFLNNGLRKFDALRMVPTYQACWILSSVLGGEFYFQEYKDLNTLTAFFFFVGTTITIGGIALLLSQPPHGVTDTLERKLPAIEKLFMCPCFRGLCADAGGFGPMHSDGDDGGDGDDDGVELIAGRAGRARLASTNSAASDGDIFLSDAGSAHGEGGNGSTHNDDDDDDDGADTAESETDDKVVGSPLAVVARLAGPRRRANSGASHNSDADFSAITPTSFDPEPPARWDGMGQVAGAFTSSV